MPSQFLGFFRCKILFFMSVKMFFHLSYDVLGIVVILHLKVCRDFCHFIGMAADRAEFPFLEPVNIGKCSAPRTTEDMVHNYVVMCAFLIKIYRCPVSLTVQIKKPNEIPISCDHLIELVVWKILSSLAYGDFPFIRAGDNIATMICERVTMEEGDIVSLASTVYSKSKGYTKPLAEITPSERALRLAKLNGEDPRFVQAVLDASQDIIMEHPFILSELPFGHIESTGGG